MSIFSLFWNFDNILIVAIVLGVAFLISKIPFLYVEIKAILIILLSFAALMYLGILEWKSYQPSKQGEEMYLKVGKSEREEELKKLQEELKKKREENKKIEESLKDMSLSKPPPPLEKNENKKEKPKKGKRKKLEEKGKKAPFWTKERKMVTGAATMLGAVLIILFLLRKRLFLREKEKIGLMKKQEDEGEEQVKKIGVAPKKFKRRIFNPKIDGVQPLGLATRVGYEKDENGKLRPVRVKENQAIKNKNLRKLEDDEKNMASKKLVEAWGKIKQWVWNGFLIVIATASLSGLGILIFFAVKKWNKKAQIPPSAAREELPEKETESKDGEESNEEDIEEDDVNKDQEDDGEEDEIEEENDDEQDLDDEQVKEEEEEEEQEEESENEPEEEINEEEEESDEVEEETQEEEQQKIDFSKKSAEEIEEILTQAELGKDINGHTIGKNSDRGWWSRFFRRLNAEGACILVDYCKRIYLAKIKWSEIPIEKQIEIFEEKWEYDGMFVTFTEEDRQLAVWIKEEWTKTEEYRIVESMRKDLLVKMYIFYTYYYNGEEEKAEEAYRDIIDIENRIDDLRYEYLSDFKKNKLSGKYLLDFEEDKNKKFLYFLHFSGDSNWKY